jgi:alkenylglycerophosphocholine/alkenylglycerophosphoethanolamine hydrolase
MFVYLKGFLPGDLIIPVALYCVTIATMGFRACSRPSGFPAGSTALGALGAVSFMVSDGCLSYGMFVYNFPHVTHVVMVTYYLAQLLIAFSATSASKMLSGSSGKGSKAK